MAPRGKPRGKRAKLTADSSVMPGAVGSSTVRYTQNSKAYSVRTVSLLLFLTLMS